MRIASRNNMHAGVGNASLPTPWIISSLWNTDELIPAAFIPTFQDCAETGYGKLLCLLLERQGGNNR